MAVPEARAALAADSRYSGHIAHTARFAATSPSFGELKTPLPGDLAAYLERKKIRLYSHQCEAIDRIRRGEHVILTSSTASGKTLSFTLPVLEALGADSSATALFLYPTKALAHDQLTGLGELEGFLGLDTRAAIYDGDTPRDRRPGIRESSRIVLSNPYELHLTLPWHTRWRRFLSSLGFVVIDEAHRYRGVLGSHVACLVRRLRRICAWLGSSPVFILSTATIANPEEFASMLVGDRVAPVEDDGAPRGERHLVLYNPVVDGRTAPGEAKDLLALCVRNGCQTICFSGSRRLAEEIAADTGARLGEDRHPGRVAAYRAGYLPEERREIERGLKTGAIWGVVSTSALELGIDVGGLDAAILAGFPGSMMAARQQAGRAGRAGQESLVVLVAQADPLDQYFMRHPEAFISRPTEHAFVDPGNPYILTGHLLCAAAELPLHSDRDRVLFGDGLDAAVDHLVDDHLLARTRKGAVYAGRGRPAGMVTLGGISGDQYRVMCAGRLLETLDRSQAYREAHPGAVLLHGGETYLVRDFDEATGTIRVDRADVDYRTRPLRQSHIDVDRVESIDGHGRVSVGFGDITVRQEYVGYTIRHFGATVGTEPLDLPPITFSTRAVWVSLPDLDEVLDGECDAAGGLHAAEHALIAAMPLLILCDRRDIGGVSTLHHPATGAATIFIHDGHEGGIGLAEKACGLLSDIARDALEMVSSCPCEEGCPSCIQSPQCGNDNRPLDKEAARAILDLVAGQVGARHPPAHPGPTRTWSGPGIRSRTHRQAS
ncbi:MAG: DEAD/DEAH box helicase [Methanomicrobiales archaeon]